MPAKIREQDSVAKDWFKQLFKIYERNLNGDRNLSIVDFKRSGFDQLMSEEFPNRKTEDWKYTNVQQILKVPFQEGKEVEIRAADVDEFRFTDLSVRTIVYVNGILNLNLSDLDPEPGFQILPLKEALNDQSMRRWILQQVEKKGGTEKNAFLPLNQAFVKNGLIVKVDRNVRVEKPIHIFYLSTDHLTETPFFHPQLYIWTGQSSALTVIESYQTIDHSSTYWHNVANRFLIEKNAHLTHYKLQQEGGKAFQTNNTIVEQQTDSCYTSFAMDIGGKLIRNNISIDLQGQNTETHLYGIYLVGDRQHIDNQTYINHAFPHCQSNELYKGIITDRARGVFNGKVIVRQDAQKTNAFQQNSSLVLSPNAVMDAKPQLEIFADDVRCSHGATIGRLDETAIFYLKSRGIPDKAAKNLLQQAFLGEVLENMDIAIIRETVSKWIEEKLGSGITPA